MNSVGVSKGQSITSLGKKLDSFQKIKKILDTQDNITQDDAKSLEALCNVISKKFKVNKLDDGSYDLEHLHVVCEEALSLVRKEYSYQLFGSLALQESLMDD